MRRQPAAEVVDGAGVCAAEPVVARICLDQLRARRFRREEPLAGDPGGTAAASDGPRPDAELQLADSIGIALLVVLETSGATRPRLVMDPARLRALDPVVYDARQP